MASRSILDIQVNDESFKKFVEAFKEYEATLGRAKEAWPEVKEASETALSAGAESAGSMAEAMGVLHEAGLGTASAFVGVGAAAGVLTEEISKTERSTAALEGRRQRQEAAGGGDGPADEASGRHQAH